MISRLPGLLLLLLGATASGETLRFAGDLASTRAFMADLAALYEASGRGEIEVDLTTATEALVRAASGEIDMGGSARAARSADRQERRAAMYPVVWDALVVVVNRDNPVRNLSLGQLLAVYSGQLRDWSALGGPARPVEVVGHEDPLHGVDRNLAALLLGDADRSLATSRTVATMEALGEAVAASPRAIGVATYSAARTMPVRIVAVDGRSASFQTIQSGAYPLYVPLYLAVREDGPNRRAVRRFIRFASSAEAKRVLRRNGVVPYPDGLSLVSRQLDRAEALERVRRAR